MARYRRVGSVVESPAVGDGASRVVDLFDESPLTQERVRELLDEGRDLGRRLGERIEKMRGAR